MSAELDAVSPMHSKLLAAQRDIALAPAGGKLLALQDAALRIAPWIASGQLPRPDAVDVLRGAAQSNGLYAQCRTGDVEHVFGMG